MDHLKRDQLGAKLQRNCQKTKYIIYLCATAEVQ